MPSLPEVAVIGAGPCGLAACKALAAQGIGFECLEAGKEVGGIWNVGTRPGGYRSLMTNTSNPNMAYPDFPFMPEQPAYLEAAEMVSYFQRYADHHALGKHIRLEHRVERVTPSADDRWQVRVHNGATRAYSAVIVATGQYTRPRNPHSEQAGSFAGEHLHVHDYFDVTCPVDLRGKRVLVVGLGTSAAEVAAELSDPDNPLGCASQVVLSARSGRWVLPKVLDGQPMDARAPHSSLPPPGLLRRLPASVSSWLMRRVMGRGLREAASSFGGYTSLGLPEPDIAPWGDRPTLSFDFIPALQAGRIDVRPAISRFAGDRVHFTDGSHAHIEVIVYATGYDIDVPFIDRSTLGCDADELSLYQRIAHPEQDGLYFVGYCPVMCSLWPVAEQQGRWIARLLDGGFQLPRPAVRRRRALPLRRMPPVMCNVYVEQLRREAGGTL